MSDNNFKPKQKITKIILKKNNVNFFKAKNPLYNINDKQNILLSYTDSNTSHNTETNGYIIKNKPQSQNKIKLFKKGLQNITITNRSRSPFAQSLTSPKLNKFNSHYNILSIPNSNLFASNDNIFNKTKFPKVNRVNEEPKNNLRNYLKKNTSNQNQGQNNERLTNVQIKRFNNNLINGNNLEDKNELTNKSEKINGIKLNNFMTLNYDNSQQNNHGINLDDKNFINKIFNNNSTINKQIYNNSPSLQAILSQLSNNHKNGENGINNKFMNNNMNSQYLNCRSTLSNNNRNLNNLFNNYSYNRFNNQLNQNNNADINNVLNYSSSFQSPNTNNFANSKLNDYLNKITQNNIFSENSFNNLLKKINIGSNPNSDCILKDFGFVSKAGDEDGAEKVNQDSYISKTKVNGLKDFNIFGVLDGHGIHGHFISELVSEYIPDQIMNNIEIKYDKDYESIYNKLINNNYQIIKDAFVTADYQLRSTYFDSSESGTTCIMIIQIGNHLISANVGDSRVIVVFDEENDPNLNFLNVIPLSIDFKPELPGERERILRSGGVIDQIKNKFGMRMGPYRVFARGKDYPGLAMSRSIGDFIGKNLGIIAEPGIVEYYIGNNTKFFVMCSDGVWEFLSNEKVKEVGKQFYLNSNAKELCQEIVSRSVIEWRTHEIGSDDITVVAGFF